MRAQGIHPIAYRALSLITTSTLSRQCDNPSHVLCRYRCFPKNWEHTYDVNIIKCIFRGLVCRTQNDILAQVRQRIHNVHTGEPKLAQCYNTYTHQSFNDSSTKAITAPCQSGKTNHSLCIAWTLWFFQGT